MKKLIAVAAVVWLSISASAYSSAIPVEFIGHWTGQAKIIVNWTKQKQLLIDIEIHPDGSVSGTVGDANLKNANIAKKSWIYTKVFQHKNLYRIKGDLQGAILKDENIKRDLVFISLKVEGGRIDGGLGTSGTKTGGKDTMILSAMAVSLAKTKEPFCGIKRCGIRNDSFALAGEEDSQKQLSGVVVDEAGLPLEGVLVDVWTWYSGNETHTGTDGKFSIGGFEQEKKTIEVRFSKDGFSPRYIFKQPIGLKNVTVVLDKNTYFQGTVTDSQDMPVGGAVVKAISGPKKAEGVMIGEVPTVTESGNDGSFRLYVQADNYDIQVESNKGVVRVSGVSISKGQAKQLDLKVGQSLTFYAKVIDTQSREPVEGVRLFSWKPPKIEGVSDANGLIVIAKMLPGKIELWVDAKRYGRWWSQDCISQWNHKRIDDETTGWQRNFDGLDFNVRSDGRPVIIEVEKAVSIKGKVVDPAGNAVEGATVSLAKTGSGNSITGDTRYNFTTDKDGGFEMFVPASGEAEYNLLAHDGKYEQWRQWANGVLPAIKTKPGEVVKNIVITLSRGVSVRGRVLDKSGRPVANRKVRSSAFDKLGNRYYDPESRTDGNGEFEIKFIRPGKNYVQVYPYWLLAEQAPKGTSQIVTILEGQVVDDIELIAQE